MTDITKYPLIDNYDSTLSQERDGAIGTMNLNAVPGITFPSGVECYITVNPGKANQQVAIIDAVDPTLKTVTVSSIAVDKSPGVTYAQATHGVGSIVRISNNYEAWQNIVDAVASKVDTNVNGTFVGTFADATARDAFITSPVNGKYSAYLTSEGFWTDYVGGAWAERATGATPNASETVAGKVEIATDAEFTAGTETGTTGAILSAHPGQIKAKNDTQDTSISTNAGNISTNSTNIGTNTTNITANTNNKFGDCEIITLTRNGSSASGTVTYSHGLGKAPRVAECFMINETNRLCSSIGFWDGTNQYSSGRLNASMYYDATSIVYFYDSASDAQTGALGNPTTTDIDVVRTKVGSPGSDTLRVVIKLRA